MIRIRGVALPSRTPADAVIYDEDPTVNPAILSHPARVILRGQVVR